MTGHKIWATYKEENQIDHITQSFLLVTQFIQMLQEVMKTHKVHEMALTVEVCCYMFLKFYVIVSTVINLRGFSVDLENPMRIQGVTL